ncbi:MAG: hypothetical protein BAJALOKI1v1_390007 [Promethearchaeota archaeon]|nr:MAG: hypothetical protein BAJALOKI1v1_390007 [Candidatus Lokiarchaeota archaeon]
MLKSDFALFLFKYLSYIHIKHFKSRFLYIDLRREVLCIANIAGNLFLEKIRERWCIRIKW